MNLHFLLIVKDEAAVIRRCLNSLLPAAPDSVIVHDTGSTDDTPDVITQWAIKNDVSLVLRGVPWVDFATNRSNLLAHASELASIDDYLWMIDADDVLVFGEENPRVTIRAQLSSMPDVVDVPIHYGAILYARPQIVRNNRPWRYRGVLHEFLDVPTDVRRMTLKGVADTPIQDGARSRDPEKFQRDAATLAQAIKDGEPDLIPRYQFYHAQSLRDAGLGNDALEAYLARLDNRDGYQDERYVAAYNVVRLAPRVYPHDPEEQYKVLCCVLDGFECSPERWELMHDLIAWLWQHGRYQFARRLIPDGPLTKAPPPGLFVEPAIYEWSLADQAAIALYYAGDYDRAFWAGYDLLTSNPAFPDSERLRVIENLRWAAEKLGPNERGVHATLLRSEILS